MQYKIIVDKQSRTNPSSEKKEYIVDIEELRVKGDVYDSLIITPEEDYVMRRLSLSDLNVLSVLPEPIKQPIPDINIELFEGDNYIYLVDMTGNKFYAEYLIKNDFNNTFATRGEMNSAINQTAQSIELSVNQKFEGYSTTEEMNSAITQKANEITSTVSKSYATKTELTTARSEIKQTTDSISSEVSKKVGKDEIGTEIIQDYESVQIAWNKISDFIQFINAQLQIKDGNKKLLMALDKEGMHFYKANNTQIGDIGLIEGNKIVFAVQNGQGFMEWGIKYKDEHSDKEAFYPVFSYTGEMKSGTGEGSGYSFTGFFDMLADIVLNEKKLFLADTTSSYIVGNILGGVSIILKGLNRGLGFSIEDPNNNVIFFTNKKQCSIVADDSFTIENSSGNLYLNMYTNTEGKKAFNFGENYIFADNIASASNIELFEGNFVNDSLLVADRDSDKSFWLHSDNSDKNLKRDIKESKINAIDKLNKIQHYEFSWKSNNNYVDNGYIAQELEKIDPNYVYKDKISNQKYRYQVNTLKILSDVTKAIQEQQEEIELLKNKIAELEAKING